MVIAGLFLDLDNHETIEEIDCIAILKDLSKEVKTAEKISLKINPPKPERESNRRRKKKSLDDDFIDISDPSSLYLYDWDHKKSQSRKQVKKKDPALPAKARTQEEEELEEIMKNHQQSFSYNSQRRTVSPLRLSLNPLNRRSMSIEAPEDVQTHEEEEDHHDLTNRESVRQLMVKNNGDSSNLNSALNDAMNDFGGADDDLVIDESPRPRKKKPLKLRLSVGSISDFNSENGSNSPFYSPSTRDAVAGE